MGLPAFFSAIVVTVFLPSMSNRAVHDPVQFSFLANRAIRLVTFVGLPVAAGIAVIARPFLDLVYGAEFAKAAPLLQILALHIPIVGMDMILGSALIAVDRQRQWVLVGAAAATKALAADSPDICFLSATEIADLIRRKS